MTILEVNSLLWTPLFLVFYHAVLIVYRLYFHPLAKIPGPKLAAATTWHEFYYNVIGNGVFCWEIKRMHDKYGPIVRINPDEVHILDPNFYDEIYAPASKKYDKYADLVALFAAPTGVFSTCPHEHHRVRRRALNISFSKQAIYQIEVLIQSKVDLLCHRFDELAARGHVLRLDAAFFALANDIITEYTFGEDHHCLDEDDFREGFKDTMMKAVETGSILRHFPWMWTLMDALPQWLLARLSSMLAAVMNWELLARRRLLAAIEAHRQGKQGSENNVFSNLLSSDLPPQEKSFQRLLDEGKSLMGAGSETVAWALILMMWHLVRDEGDILSRLRAELRDMPRDNGSEVLLLKWLEKKPYLTPMSSTNYWIHMDETIFPSPTKFSPERWLGTGQTESFLQSLAMAELYLTAAAVVTRFDIEFVDTSAEDIEPARERFIARPVLHSKGVFAKLQQVSKNEAAEGWGKMGRE
ncbi:hypothetical protein E4U43_008547 [Claviceps pusilla]|uniref:Cytochrome P450 n=1 Tax=Claviceps pusilla TaxID=123648 RepID=A0A9P7T0P9_9HYPO|nr:hypothetical protein E4U43_008547 [Claviceps pusilla]